jgi:acyl-[acyl-carrier-protein]-phospholipid O-acyltransferase/long-chain-fatty-acid--[acyl-carrier-protein] ligase
VPLAPRAKRGPARCEAGAPGSETNVQESQAYSTADRFDAKPADSTIFQALLAAAAKFGKSKPILEDHENPCLSYGRLVIGSFVLGKKLTAGTDPKRPIGLLLPNTNAMAVTLLALNAFGRTAALLNFTAGARNIVSAVDTAQVQTIVTSRRFIGMAGLEAVRDALLESRGPDGEARRVIYLEDVRKTVGTFDKVGGMITAARAASVHKRHAQKPDDPAVILFTSGTEAAPKAVVLSNRNVVANARQIWQHADGMLTADDTVLNPLPMFHSFGLTAGTLMPLMNGMRVVLYPSPLHYKEIPKLIAKRGATVLFATDSFLQGYARSAGDGDLNALRHVIAGAERVRDGTRRMWEETGANLLEGYGATECAPVIACNLPPSNTPGSVGPMLPGLEARLEPVPGIERGGRLYVRGPNVMLGYIMPERPGELVPTHDGWHDTGDIVTIDDTGLIAIQGRAKRFAKIGGEMVSLAAVEQLVSSMWPENSHVVLNVPDERKGEQLVLLTDHPAIDRAELLAGAREQGFSELWLPRRVISVPEIPVLGSGKIDFPAARRMFEDQFAQAA